MKKILKAIIFLSLTLKVFAFDITSNDDYRVYKNDKYSIIFTEDNENDAKFIKKNLDKFLVKNNKLFSYSFDTPLKISLISNNIQIANAFSTQSPSNMAVLYNGGSSSNNYFANTSWLKSLMIHELAHNYQINAKKSKISKYLHKVLGNNFAPIWVGVPFFTIPNAYLPTFMLEGNAVLNETLYDNGGRLYNGNLNALKNTLIFANKVNPKTLINDTLSFPYGEMPYIVGGFYMQYMAKTYGIQKVNSFFYKHSIHSINPFLINRTYSEHFGISFEKSINDFVEYTRNEYKNYNELKKKPLVISQSKIYFSKIKNQIYFITSDLKTKKELNVYDIASNNFTKQNTTLDNSRLFKQNDTLYSSSSHMINSTNYKYGLFDESQNILQNTIGKAIQDISFNKIAYIKIKDSFNSSKLYINNKYINNISSNAIFDESQNIYYFKQDGRNRVLYKNKNSLVSVEGYFSKVVSILNDEIYFISNSKNGSTLYKYSNNTIIRLSPYDNIISAKIINKNKAIVSSVRADNYSVNIIELKDLEINNIAKINNVKFKKEFIFDDNISFILPWVSYNSVKELQYVSTLPTMISSEDDTVYTINTLLEDTLGFNKVNLFLYKDNDDKYLSTTYINTRYQINYLINYYKINRTIKANNSRNYGAELQLLTSIYKNANHTINVNIKKQFDDENKDKNPIAISLNHNFNRSFNQASDYDILSDTKLIYKNDRSDDIYGIKYDFTKHIGYEFYFNSNYIYLSSNSNLGLREQRGIKVVTTSINTLYDDTRVLMQGFDYNFYVKDMKKISVGVSKPFYITKYFSKFPFSLRKEKVSLKYHQYNFNTYKQFIIKEKEFSLNFDILFAHKFSIPVELKYITNDYSKDNYKYFINLGITY